MLLLRPFVDEKAELLSPAPRLRRLFSRIVLLFLLFVLTLFPPRRMLLPFVMLEPVRSDVLLLELPRPWVLLPTVCVALE